MTATLLLYRQITPLNRDNHRELKLVTGSGKADFAKQVHYVPLAGAEFYQAARDYPVLFAGGDEAAPVALLGLRKDENLFLENDGQWAAGTYVPAFVRRYPFVLADVQKNNEEFTVCIDDAFSGFSTQEGTALFDTEGKETNYLKGTIEFLNHFLAEMRRTQEFAETLSKLNLLTKRNLRISDDRGRRFLLRDFRIIDEAKLAELDDKTLGELQRKGYLGWIYAHLISIGNAARLPARLREADVSRPAQGEVLLEPAESESTN